MNVNLGQRQLQAIVDCAKQRVGGEQSEKLHYLKGLLQSLHDQGWGVTLHTYDAQGMQQR